MSNGIPPAAAAVRAKKHEHIIIIIIIIRDEGGAAIARGECVHLYYTQHYRGVMNLESV